MSEQSRNSRENKKLPLSSVSRLAAVCLSSAAAAAGGAFISGCGGTSRGGESTTSSSITSSSSKKVSAHNQPAVKANKPSVQVKPTPRASEELSLLLTISKAAVLTKEEVNTALGDPQGTINVVTSDPVIGNNETAAAMYSSGTPTSEYGQPNSLRIAISNYSGAPPSGKLTAADIQELRTKELAAGVPKADLNRAIASLEQQTASEQEFTQSGFTGFVNALPANVALIPWQTEADIYGNGIKIAVLGDSPFIESAPLSTKESVFENLGRLVAERISASS